MEGKAKTQFTPTGGRYYRKLYCDSVRVGDSRLGIHPKAWAVLAMLDLYRADLTDAAAADEGEGDLHQRIEFSSWPWFNGRERGACVVGYNWSDPSRTLYVTFGEDRNSDALFVDCWQAQGIYGEPPGVEDMPAGPAERNWRKQLNRHTFVGADAAAQHVVAVCERWARGDALEGQSDA